MYIYNIKTVHMKIKNLLFSAAGMLVMLAASSFSASAAGKAKGIPGEVSMSKQVLQDKIRGAWAGQLIGCTYGGPTEFKYSAFIPDEYPIDWHEHIIKWWYDHVPGLYDDIYMDLTFVDVFEKEGLDAPVSSFANAFVNADYPLWHANLQARYNILHGIMPPESGHWKFNAHADDIDFQIEADYAGIMAPGMVNSAVRFTDEIGHIMNYGDGWYGGVYVAALYSLAFVSDDIPFIVKEALKTVPSGSRYYKCIADVIKWWQKYPDNWHLTWALVNEKYGYDIGCPSGFNSASNIDAVINSAYIVIGLLYGGGNFYRTIDISTRCGHDSDCNPASAGGILGTILGFNKIPAYWKTPVYEVEDIDFKYTDISLNRACKMSFRQALQVIEREGGRTEGSTVTIKTQKPAAVRLEQSFEGHWPVAKKNIKKTPYKMGEYTFEGKGAVFTYHFTLPKPYSVKGYEAEVEVWVDGKLYRTVLLPTSGNGQTRELCGIWDLPIGEHKVSFKWTNKPDDINMVIDSVNIFSDKPKAVKHVDK